MGTRPPEALAITDVEARAAFLQSIWETDKANPVSKEEAAAILSCAEECVVNHCISTDDLLKWMRFAADLGDSGITLNEVAARLIAYARMKDKV